MFISIIEEDISFHFLCVKMKIDIQTYLSWKNKYYSHIILNLLHHNGKTYYAVYFATLKIKEIADGSNIILCFPAPVYSS